RDGERILPGRIFVAPAGHYLLVQKALMQVVPDGRGGTPQPWIDELFPSAAVAHGPEEIAVVLPGALTGGPAGPSAVKRCGGIAVVQDPGEAAHSSMPLSALRNVAVDYCLPLGEIGPLLDRLTQAPPPATKARRAESGEAPEGARPTRSAVC